MLEALRVELDAAIAVDESSRDSTAQDRGLAARVGGREFFGCACGDFKGPHVGIDEKEVAEVLWMRSVEDPGEFMKIIELRRPVRNLDKQVGWRRLIGVGTAKDVGIQDVVDGLGRRFQWRVAVALGGAFEAGW